VVSIVGAVMWVASAAGDLVRRGQVVTAGGFVGLIGTSRGRSSVAVTAGAARAGIPVRGTGIGITVTVNGGTLLRARVVGCSAPRGGNTGKAYVAA